MKRTKIYIIGLLAMTFMLSSCLKDEKVGTDWTSSLKGKAYAYIFGAGFTSLGLQPTANAQYFTFKVAIASDAVPANDITVKVGLNQAALTAYNSLKGTSYKLFPSANLQILTPNVTIKAGTRYSDNITVKVTGADKLNACDNYMAPIGITEASSNVIIASNGNLLMALPISNPYAGTYHVIGYRIRPGNAPEPVEQDEEFKTLDCKTVIKNGFGNYTPFDIKIEITTNTVVVGGTTCYKVICTVLDASGAVQGGMWDVWTGDANQVPKPVTLDINYYNPVTKVFVLNCYYNSSAGNRIMYEICTRK